MLSPLIKAEQFCLLPECTLVEGTYKNKDPEKVVQSRGNARHLGDNVCAQNLQVSSKTSAEKIREKEH